MGNSIYRQRIAARSCSISPATRPEGSPTNGPSAPPPASPTPGELPLIASPVAMTADRADTSEAHPTRLFAGHEQRARRAELTFQTREAALELRSRELTRGR